MNTKGITMKSSFRRRLTTLIGFSLLPFISMNVLAQSSVWQVSKDKDHIYIGGTVHILPASEFPLPKEFETAYQNSDAIVLETKLPDSSDMAFQMQMMQQMTYSNGKNINDYLTNGTQRKLSEHLNHLGADIVMFQHFKPGFLMTMIALFEAKKAGLSGEGVDMFYSNKANRDKKKIEYFESAEFQMQMIERLGKGSEDKFIKANLSQMSDFKTMFTALLSAWRSGNEQKLVKLAITPLKADPQSLKLMLTDRNRSWVQDIDKMFKDSDKEFVLVGVAHLVGKNSVLDLLKAKGYQVTKL